MRKDFSRFLDKIILICIKKSRVLVFTIEKALGVNEGKRELAALKTTADILVTGLFVRHRKCVHPGSQKHLIHNQT